MLLSAGQTIYPVKISVKVKDLSGARLFMQRINILGYHLANQAGVMKTF